MLSRCLRCVTSVEDEQREGVIVPDADVCAEFTDPTHCMCRAADRRDLHCSDPGSWTQRYDNSDHYRQKTKENGLMALHIPLKETRVKKGRKGHRGGREESAQLERLV